MSNNTFQSRLETMIIAGYPIFVIGNNVVLPVEAEDFFAPEELDSLREYICSFICQ